MKIPAIHFDPGGVPEHPMTGYERVLAPSPGENHDGWQDNAVEPRRELPDTDDGVTNIIEAILRNKTSTGPSIMEGDLGNSVPASCEKHEIPREDRQSGVV
jgi:hypothetical protein